MMIPEKKEKKKISSAPWLVPHTHTHALSSLCDVLPSPVLFKVLLTLLLLLLLILLLLLLLPLLLLHSPFLSLNLPFLRLFFHCVHVTTFPFLFF